MRYNEFCVPEDEIDPIYGWNFDQLSTMSKLRVILSYLTLGLSFYTFLVLMNMYLDKKDANLPQQKYVNCTCIIKQN